MARDKDASCIGEVGAVLAEGPVWVEREDALYWVDILERRVFRWSEADGVRRIETGTHICSLAPRARGGFIGAGYEGFLAIDLDAGAVDVIADPEGHLETNRFNDGKTDRMGRFWAGTMDRFEREASGSLYRLDPDLGWTRIDTGYRVTNGPAFSLDGRTMYHSDSALRRIYAFDLDQDGGATGRRLFAAFGEHEGYPDGMTVDADGCLWIAFWDAWCVRRLAPSGEWLAELALPLQRPTSCAFGGPGYDQLFVTSASRGLDEKSLGMQPSAGGLFMVMPGVKGVPDAPFAG